MNLFTNNELGISGRRNFFVFSGVFLIIIVLAGGGYAVWNRYFSSEAQTQRNYQKYVDWQANYDKAMREDTYGGKTPQETLDMFVAALRAGDVELASKYFMLNGAGKVDQKWVDYLINIKNKGLMNQMASDLEKDARPVKPSYEGDYGFSLLNDDGTVGVLVDMQFNSQSKVWKIESL